MKIEDLFPVVHGSIVLGFTTSSIDIPTVQRVSLSDKSLGVHKVTSATTHKIVKLSTPSGEMEAWEAIFPEGSINPGNKQSPPGGFGFYLPGPAEFHQALQDDIYQEVIMSYQVLFQDDWKWQKGGKLPGIYGGTGDSSYGCTGGRQTDRCKCFNLRLMWRENGIGELYAYLPMTDSNTEELCKVPPKSIQHPDYGFSVGRGAFQFPAGQWITVSQRVKINDPEKLDGEIEVFIDGKSVLLASGLSFRDSVHSKSHVQGLHFQTFFGGHSADWASPQTQKAWFTNISGAILKPSRSISSQRDEL
ncbi:Polysaccharide lyase 14 [Abortiporus biennis]